MLPRTPAVHADREEWRRQLRQVPARVQWDPERDLPLRPLAHRSLQLGLAGPAARKYADEWTVGITDVTPLAHEIHALRDTNPGTQAAGRGPAHVCAQRTQGPGSARAPGHASTSIDNDFDSVKKSFQDHHPVIVATPSDDDLKSRGLNPQWSPQYVTRHVFYVKGFDADGKMLLGNPWESGNDLLTGPGLRAPAPWGTGENGESMAKWPTTRMPLRVTANHPEHLK